VVTGVAQPTLLHQRESMGLPEDASTEFRVSEPATTEHNSPTKRIHSAFDTFC